MRNLFLGSTIAFATVPLDLALDGVAAAGFKYTEIGAVKGWFEHLDPETLDDAGIAEVKQQLQARGLTAVSLSGHSQLQTREGTERFKKALRLARQLGMSVVNTNTGEVENEADKEAFLRHMQEIADEAERLGLVIGLETDSNLLATARDGVKILEAIGRSVVRMNYDTGNVIYYADADPLEDIKHALPHLAHMHLKDKIGGRKVFNFPQLGTGQIDVPRVLRILDEAGYAGPISVEIEYDEKGWPEYETCRRALRGSWEYLHSLGVV